MKGLNLLSNVLRSIVMTACFVVLLPWIDGSSLAADNSSIPALEMPDVPVINTQTQTAPQEADVSLQISFKEGMKSLEGGDAAHALQTFQGILLDYPQDKIPIDVYLGMSKAYRRLKEPNLAVVTLLPLLKSQKLASANPSDKRKFMFELGLADAMLHNDEGTERFLVPVFPSLERPDQIYEASGILDPYFARVNPLLGVQLLGGAIDKVDPSRQKDILSMVLDLIHDHIVSESDLSTIHRSFPHEFPGDYALFRLSRLEAESGRNEMAEQDLLRVLVEYPSSLFLSSVQDRLNNLSYAGGTTSIGMILPPLSDRLRGPFAHSILAGLVSFYRTHQYAPRIVVRFAKSPKEYRKRYETLFETPGVMAMVGPFFTDDLKAIWTLLKDRRYPSLTPTLPPSRSLPTLFSTATLPEMMASAAAIETQRKVPSPSVVILYPDQIYGKTVSKTYGNILKSGGGRVLGRVPYRTNHPDHQKTLEKLKRYGKVLQIKRDLPLPPGSARVSEDAVSIGNRLYYLNQRTVKGVPGYYLFFPAFNALYIPDTSMHPSTILRELAYKNIQNISVFGNETFLTTNNLNGVEDLHVSVYATGAPAASAGVRRRPTALFTLQTYDALSVLALAARNGANDARSLLSYLKDHPSFSGRSGDLSWDGPGKFRKTVGIYRLSKNRWIPTDKIEVSYPAPE